MKKSQHDAAASFFGDDELDDWFDDDADAPKAEAVAVDADGIDPSGEDVPAGAVAVVPDEVERLTRSVDEAVAPVIAPVEPTRSVAPDEEATLPAEDDAPAAFVPLEGALAPAADLEPAPTADLEPAPAAFVPLDAVLPAAPSHTAPPRRVAPPPPPVYVARSVHGTRTGYLDTILPKTLEPPRLATTPSPIGIGPELVDAVGIEPVRSGTWKLPEGADAWREAIAVLELEAQQDGAARSELLLQAAHVRLACLGDADGARKRLDEAASEDVGAIALRAVAADAASAPEAWRARAETLTGASAADAWRHVAALAASPAVEREALEAALAADPTDVAASDRLLEVLRASDDAAALAERLAAHAERVDPSHRARLAAERGVALARADRHDPLARVYSGDEAIAAWREALDADPDHGGASLALEDALRARGDHEGLAALYGQLAARRPDDAAAWSWAAARALRRAGLADQADAAFDEAGAAGASWAARDQEAGWLREGQADRLLAAALGRPADDPARGAALFRAGVALERAGGDPDAVAEAYRAALAAGFAPAGDPLESALEAAGAWDDLLELVERRVAAWDVPRPADLVRLAEVVEAREPGSPAAVEAWRAVADHGDLDGVRGLARTARAAGRTADLTDALRRLVAEEPDADVRAARAYELGGLLAATDPDAAVEAYLKASEASAGAVLALEGVVTGLLARGAVADAADRLAARAALVEGAAASAWTLESARLLARVDTARALDTLDRLLAADPGHAAALRLLGRLAGARRPDVLRTRWRVEGTGQGRLAAATWDVLEQQDVPADVVAPGADELALLRLLGVDDPSAWTTALLDQGRELPPGLLALAIELDDATAHRLLASAAPGQPAARLAERLGRADLAVELGAGLPRRERERLAIAAAPDARAAVAAARGRLEAEADAADLAELARLAATTGDVALRLAAHAALAGALALAAGDEKAAVSSWSLALHDRPGSFEALEGARAAMRAARDVEGLLALPVGDLRDDRRALAEALVEIEPILGVEAWRALTADGGLVDRLGLEIALAAAGDWAGLFEAWTSRLDATLAPSERERLERKRRWVLAEKLAETDHAWTMYRTLHEADPEDREVVESLARIAGARGDLEVAVAFLSDLVRTAASPREAARYQRRIADVHVGHGDDAAARQAFLDALDHDSEDLEALQGLRALAERTEDWETLHAVLKREASLVSEVRRIEVQRELARLAEAKLDDPPRALDAWRAVLADVPADEEALRRLLAIADQTDDDPLFLDTGRVLASIVRGAERSALLRKLGERSEATGRIEDATGLYEQAVGAEVPDLEAARQLERLYREANDNVGVVRTLIVQADLLDDTAAAVDVLLKAARTSLEILHDRDGACRIHERVLQEDPDQPDALRFLATYLFETGRLHEALAVHERLEPTIEPGDHDDVDDRIETTAFFFRLAEMLRAEGHVDEARVRYERVLALNASHLPTLEAVGPIYVAARAWKEAGAVYQRLLQLTGGQGEPEQVAHTFTMLGLVDHHEGRTDRAFKRFHRALEAFANYVPALKGLAAVHEEREEWQALLTAYNGVIFNATIASDVIEAYMTKGRVLDEQLERADKAAQHYEGSLVFDAAQPGAYLRLAELALRRAGWEEAADYAQRGIPFAAEDATTSALLHLALAIARHQVEDPGAAEALARAASLTPELADALGAEPLGEPDRARALLRERLPR